MGQLIHIRGDLFTSDAHIIAHGCNCRGGFGSGVAGQVARLFPVARDSYLKKFHSEGWKLGDVQFVPTDPHKWYWIANMATQDTFGGPGVHVDYEAVRKCFKTLLAFVEDLDLGEEDGNKVAIPKIGAGLAGGDWATIEGIIRDELQHRNVRVECYTYD